MRVNSTSLTHLGRYEIIGEIGQGAMGTVYKARDPILDRSVAIKTINLTLPKEDIAEYEARFYQEAKAAGQLSHPNIVIVFDVGRAERLAYMAMEYLEGHELRSLLLARAPIPAAKALDIAAQVADGLQFAHDHEVVHRDIKPANIMVLNDGAVKITDFGIARLRDNDVKTMTGMILGSPKYMSPEQVSGKRADAQSDIFSLGVVLYEMLTGTSPFIADNVHGVMFQTMNFTPPAPRTLNHELPEIVNLIVAKALAKEVENRYQRARDLAADLRQARGIATGEGTQDLLAISVGGIDLQHTTLFPPSEFERTNKFHTSDTVEIANKPPASQDGVDTVQTAQPALGLSKIFDSAGATLKLASLTGAGRQEAMAATTHPASYALPLRGAEVPAADGPEAQTPVGTTDTWHNPQLIEVPDRTRNENRLVQYVWIASAAILAVSLFLFLRH
jgi:serine/threonine-protein kinase